MGNMMDNGLPNELLEYHFAGCEWHEPTAMPFAGR